MNIIKFSSPGGRSIMLTRDKDPRRRGDELFDGQKNRQSDKQAEPTEPPTHLIVMK